MPNGKKRIERSQESAPRLPQFPLPRDSHVLAAVMYQQTQNIGLLFNKFLCIWNHAWTLDAKFKDGKREKSAKSWFLERVESTNRSYPQDAYYAFVERQVKLADSFRDRGYMTTVFGKRAEARILTGLGGAHPMEVGFAFHPLYGFPYLPGSGVKGVARAWAELTGEDPAKIKLVFGSESKDERQAKEHQQGDVIFLDAYAVTPPKLEVDILNPHFPEYYRDPKKNLPTEWQSPSPVNFLTIGIGKEQKDNPIFQFGLSARSAEVLHLAQNWLEGGLEQLGFGGKTASGYGYFAEGRLTVEEMAKIRDQVRRVETSKPSATKPSPVEKIIAKHPATEQPGPTTIRPKPEIPPPKAPKPVAKPTIREGDRLEAEVMANDGRRVKIRLLEGVNQEITLEQAYYPHRPGAKVKVKVISVSSDGKVTKARPV